MPCKACEERRAKIMAAIGRVLARRESQQLQGYQPRPIAGPIKPPPRQP